MNRSRWALLGFLAVIGFFVVTEHRAHVFGVLPYLLLLACPLLHAFHHRGHRGGGQGKDAGHGSEGQRAPDDSEERKA